ncbi:carboxylic ester hydrolase-like isoform X2 [Periplaneta americana]
MLLAILSIIFLAVLRTTAGNMCDGSQPIEVTLKDGRVRGDHMTSAKGKPFCAFLGIPFAQPPIGDLRFKPPQPVRPWKGILNATELRDECVQLQEPLGTLSGNEDCLYINVCTPQLAAHNGSLLPVIVFISGGAFYSSSSNIFLYKPQLLMDREVVVVYCNYRVGSFGFLTTEDDESPGNYGMKDQVAVLRWVRDNIKTFGGNPDRVTILGHSAGSAAVHFHILSPMSEGLFHNAISMDGVAINPWASGNSIKHTKKLAKFLGCPTEPTAELMRCLRTKPADEIVGVMHNLFDFWILLTSRYSPVVEKQTERNPEPFLTKEPLQQILDGNFHKVPWMLGGNTHSSAYYMSYVYNIKVLRDQVIEKGRLLLPKIILFHDLEPEIYRKMTQYYGINDPYATNFEDEMKFIDLTTKRFFVHGTNKAALLHSLAGHKQIYRYNLAYRSFFSTTILTSLKNYGVSHGDELRYLFQFPGILMHDSANDLEVQEIILTLWMNFVKYGNPTPANKTTGLLENFVWEPVGEVNETYVQMRYLNIGQVMSPTYNSPYLNMFLGPVKINMGVNLNEDDMKFWDSLSLPENVPCAVCEKIISGSRREPVQPVILVVCVIFWYWIK